MKWNKYRMKTTTEAVDLISYTLGEMGIEGIEIEDKIPLSDEDKKKMFIDILPDLGEDDGVAYVSFYIEPEKDHAETLQEVTEAVKELADFVDIGDATIEKSETADVDWMNNWKKFWKPFKVDDKIIIKPTWEKLAGRYNGGYACCRVGSGYCLWYRHASYDPAVHHTDEEVSPKRVRSCLMWAAAAVFYPSSA